MRNFHVSIHHSEGRTKPLAHILVLPLCAGHHQDGTGAPGLLAIHPWKRQFVSDYGREIDLLADCIQQLAGMGVTLPDEVGRKLSAQIAQVSR